MASLTGYTKVFAGDTTAVDSTLKHPLGTRAFDKDGNEYIYLTGVGSTAIGSCVTYTDAHITALSVADAVGRVAFAMAATIASTYGWYQIYGKHTTGLGSWATPFIGNDALWLSASGGRVDGVPVAGDLIQGAMNVSAATNYASPLTIWLNYPHTDNLTGA